MWVLRRVDASVGNDLDWRTLSADQVGTRLLRRLVRESVCVAGSICSNRLSVCEPRNFAPPVLRNRYNPARGRPVVGEHHPSVAIRSTLADDESSTSAGVHRIGLNRAATRQNPADTSCLLCCGPDRLQLHNQRCCHTRFPRILALCVAVIDPHDPGSASRRTRSAKITLVHLLRCAAENPFNHRVECCRAPARHADTPGCDPSRLLPGYVGDGVAPNEVIINIEHDVSRNPHLFIVEGAQDGCAHHAQHRPHVHRIPNGLEERVHRRIVIEPGDRARDFVFGHEATYTPGPAVEQIPSEP